MLFKDEHISVDQLYTKLDTVETDEHEAKGNLEKMREIIKNKNDELQTATFQFKKIENTIKRLEQEKNELRSMITIERERISQQHQETIKKLREMNEELVKSITLNESSISQTYQNTLKTPEKNEYSEINSFFTPNLNLDPDQNLDTNQTINQNLNPKLEKSPKSHISSMLEAMPNPLELPEVYQYRKKLAKHMDKYKYDPWCEIFTFVLAYEPTDDNFYAIKYVNHIPNRELCRLYCRECHAWLNIRKDQLKEAVKNKHTFLDFVLNMRNVVCMYKKEPTITKQELYKRYDISE